MSHVVAARAIGLPPRCAYTVRFHEQKDTGTRMKHLLNVLAHGSLAVALTLAFGLGVAFHGSLVELLGLALLMGTATLLPGVAFLIFTRMTFKLMSAGRFAEIATFGLIGAVVFKLAALAGWLSLTTIALAPGFATVLLVVPLAFITGNLKSFSRRSWLPQRMPPMPPKQ